MPTVKLVTKCLFSVGKSLEDNNFAIYYALFVDKCLFVCR